MDTGLARAVIGGPFLFETQTLTLDHQKSVEIGRNKRGDESHFELKEGREKSHLATNSSLVPRLPSQLHSETACSVLRPLKEDRLQAHSVCGREPGGLCGREDPGRVPGGAGQEKASGSLSVVLKGAFGQGGGLPYQQDGKTRPQLDLLNNLRVGCKLFWRQVTGVWPREPRNVASPWPSSEDGTWLSPGLYP